MTIYIIELIYTGNLLSPNNNSLEIYFLVAVYTGVTEMSVYQEI